MRNHHRTLNDERWTRSILARLNDIARAVVSLCGFGDTANVKSVGTGTLLLIRSLVHYAISAGPEKSLAAKNSADVPNG